jgi:hypothetical protein
LPALPPEDLLLLELGMKLASERELAVQWADGRRAYPDAQYLPPVLGTNLSG